MIEKPKLQWYRLGSLGAGPRWGFMFDGAHYWGYPDLPSAIRVIGLLTVHASR